jgi:hypothetical protein
MRVAHAGGDRPALDRQLQRVDLLGQRNVCQSAAGWPMLTEVSPPPASSQAAVPRPVVDGELRLARLVHQVARDTARGIAAGRRAGAVGIVEHQRGIRAVRARSRQAGRSPRRAAGRPARAPSRPLNGRSPHRALVDHHEIVAQPVHFHEGQRPVSARAVMARIYAGQRARIQSRHRRILPLTPGGVFLDRAPEWAVSSVGRATDF